MELFLDFICANWYYIIIIFFSFLSVLLALVKKKRVITLDIFTDALKDTFIKLPEFIKNVESLDIPGSDKKALVISSALRYFVCFIGRELTDSEDKYLTAMFDKMIEKILDTPQKK